ncbi:tRNA pseudouridine(55) synthase TruB [Clavibacter michiganensis]|uniref:tRNA pseudouridine synthase B n=1 Tax=Clavibacter michiganensis subsp. insidiosus TaxID=33014 RepID=A0A0D5CIH1_9MICO|nr:tRNA pseudouridine(55) synthase TruB [Clavibacter michiganensis]AJW79416.1 tRNA pseudouridine synthase B [Clavibacter michiganensis subsp. insidiosus]AWF97843.1 tRNA pseudouridine(55) synthase [Clavibacter michiganensis subsp. insidiosus]AWG01957.1 tRNA pseudouridine(55) synthase [Clavibacter michiganensis subsp. insidiosus]OQJ59547.1 tRNA pseudouridine(55) synthase [Clavibacter michiganensis subsp. insidiosus]RII87236.1 tRNA pseudouridine(55) synthase TruB [Clavibacter michiganensis subsp.
METPTPRAAPSTASGLLLIDKRGEWTSHDLVARTRRLAGTRKVGHAGTLDPMATGLMILGVNSSTRLLTYLVGLDKEYLATIRLGRATTTDDREGEVVSRAEPGRIRDLAVADVERAIADLRGTISQVPSAVSAIKVDGERAYARVRAGEEVELAAREVTVSAFDVLRFDAVEAEEDGAQLDLSVRITCSSGTYVRALARDLGRALGVGGHLTALRRTRVGPFHVDDAVAIDDMVVADRLIPPADAAARLFDVLHLTDQEAVDLGHGKKLTTPDEAPTEDPLAAVAPDGRLVGLVGFRGRTGTSIVNFPADEAGAS